MRANHKKAVSVLFSTLGVDHTVLIGGHAVSAWGFERGTKDVDVATDLPAKDVVAKLAAAGITATIREGFLGDPIPWSVNGKAFGVPFNILPPLERLSIRDGIRVEIPGATLRVCKIEDLIRLKFYAGAQKDILDVASLVLLRKDLEKYAQEQAKRYEVERQYNSALTYTRPALTPEKTESEPAS